MEVKPRFMVGYVVSEYVAYVLLLADQSVDPQRLEYLLCRYDQYRAPGPGAQCLPKNWIRGFVFNGFIGKGPMERAEAVLNTETHHVKLRTMTSEAEASSPAIRDICSILVRVADAVRAVDTHIAFI
ncbi:MAG: hypothetical protein ACKPKO_46065, partial [Candidatus Fonsibacter sp.]